MAIWKIITSPEDISAATGNSIGKHLGIEVTEVGEDYIVGTMPVDYRTIQPYGILHGGASVVLAESLGSVGGGLLVDFPTEYVVGLEVNANHLRPVAAGETVKGIARPLHIGSKTQVWDIKIYNSKEQLTCVCRLTLAVVKNQSL